jgi:hypothetical protein
MCDTFLKCRHDLVGRQREHRALRGFGQLSKRTVCGQAGHLRRARVHWQYAASVAEAAQVHYNVVAERAFAR